MLSRLAPSHSRRADSAETSGEVGGWTVVIADGHAVLPNGMKHLPDKGQGVQQCTALVSVACPRSLISIGDNAFGGCTSLTSIALPTGLTRIGDFAFDKCSLTCIGFPAHLAFIGNGAFFRCRALTSVTLPAGLTSIGARAFYGCSSLTAVKLPAGIASIGVAAFYRSSLPRVIVPITAEIADDAFPSSVTTPSSVARPQRCAGTRR